MVAFANSPDRRLNRKLQEMIDGEYQQRAKLAPKGSVDPFRMACYKVVGRCDLGSETVRGRRVRRRLAMAPICIGKTAVERRRAGWGSVWPRGYPEDRDRDWREVFPERAE